jgi:hypothetical protein
MLFTLHILARASHLKTADLRNNNRWITAAQSVLVIVFDATLFASFLSFNCVEGGEEVLFISCARRLYERL